MSLKYVGVVAAASDSNLIKRASLLCDEVICDDAPGDAKQALELGLVRSDLHAELIRSLERLPVSEHQDVYRYMAISRTEVFGALGEISSHLQAIGTLLRQNQTNPTAATTAVMELLDHAARAGTDAGDLFTRFHAEVLRLSAGEEVWIPILHGTKVSALPSIATGRGAVLRIVLEQLPLPNAETPWEAIRDWKQDEEAMEKYRALRAWMSRLARENIDAADVEEEFASRLTTYERYMALQHRKMQRTRMEAVILPLAEIAEDLVHIRLSNAAQKLFGLFKEEITLLESEITAPGREVAYIASSKERFGLT